jgi:hypothetical protein
VVSAGATGAARAIGAGAVCLLMSCSYLPAGRERAHVEEMLRAEPGIVGVEIDCGSAVLAGDRLCVDVTADDGARIRFERVGFNSMGATAVNVIVAEAAGLVPRIASCAGVTAPNIHREGPLGHHFSPSLIDLKEAVTRRREVLEEIQYWPQCPQFWDVQDKRGQNYRYCARRRDATDEPPRPANCS